MFIGVTPLPSGRDVIEPKCDVTKQTKQWLHKKAAEAIVMSLSLVLTATDSII